MPNPDRGSVWIADLGLAAKIRPCLVLSVPPSSQERLLVNLIPHTTSLRGTRFEVPVQSRFLSSKGAFDAKQVITIPQVKLVGRLGVLQPAQLKLVEDAVKRWLGL
jgi:mRNA interferase MazF